VSRKPHIEIDAYRLALDWSDNHMSAISGDTRVAGIGDTRRQRRCDGGIDGVPAFAKNLRAGFCSGGAARRNTAGFWRHG